MTDLKSVGGKRVILRADLDVAVGKGGRIAPGAAWRLKKSLASMVWLAKRGAITLIIGHRGRPNGIDKNFSLAPIAHYLQKQLRRPVRFFSNIVEATAAMPHLQPGEIALLENLRFDPREKKNDGQFARTLAALGDLYVNDAFATAHRAHASVVAITKYLPRYAGRQLVAEIAALEKVLRHPRRPLVAIIGGIKMETKVPIIKNLLRHGAAHILLGGGIATTFLAAQGYELGKSIVDTAYIPTARKLLKDKRIMLPRDFIIGSSTSSITSVSSTSIASISSTSSLCSPKEAIMDVGPVAVREFAKIIGTAKTIVWNGPLGQFEKKPFSRGTNGIARAVAAAHKKQAYTVAGGGETVHALIAGKLAKNIDHISTGGGAMLEFLAGKKLPGIRALN